MTFKLNRRRFVSRLIKRIFLLLLVVIFGVILFNYDTFYRLIQRGESYTYTQANCDLGSDNKYTLQDGRFQEVIVEARDSILKLKKTYNIPGLSICVSIQGEIIWNQGFGCSDIENNRPVTNETLFRIGSISKSMTAIGVLKLVQDGKIDLNQNVSHYYSQFPKKEYTIPVKYLASHQSGIRHYNGFEMLSNKHYNSVKESLEPFVNDQLLFEPGTNYKYSTYNYVLLSRLIETITSSNYINFMSQEVFLPLQMLSTFPEKKSDSIMGYSSGINSTKIKNAIEVDLSNKYAGGGYISTAKDLVLMMQNLDSLLSKESQSKLFEIQKFKNGDDTASDYALGFRNTYLSNTGRTLIHHGGSSIGGRAFLLKLVEDDIVVAICANSDTGILRPQNFDLQEVYDISKLFLIND
ncbi:serine hydrolase domain-containing protein [uncultured Psychroserpens sp.]|uniref:serine hydrolase domain-containing protein n=1 Tax=uncultured Psychroserpens sp. TaxID=255436 RepID=UPI00261CEAB7|nr:serine hydrolase domain-containing protein [uncultured Psychroserpens sp.]